MILGIEGDKTKEHISSVHVKSVTIGGAAYRATGSSKGIAVGDEILQVNGLDLKTLSHDECITVFKEMLFLSKCKIRCCLMFIYIHSLSY
jgi:C-terminal processing protease CtpA/Prc